MLYFLTIIFIGFNSIHGVEVDPRIVESPAPQIFQYGFDDNDQSIGIINLKIPIEDAEYFFIICEFLPREEKYMNPKLVPKIHLIDEENPEKVLRGIYNRNRTTFHVNYHPSAPAYYYPVGRLWFTDTPLLVAKESKFCSF